MTFDPKILKENTRQTLNRAPSDPRRITLLYEGALVAVGILLAALSLFLKMAMDNAGGLSGLGLRSILSTVIAVAGLAQSLLSPFWSIGIVFAALGFARAQAVKADALLEGFRRFGACLRLMLVQILLTAAASFVATYAASTLYALMPTSNSLLSLIGPLQNEFMADPYAILAQLPAEELFRAMLPLLLITVVVLSGVMIPLMYFLRLSFYILLDQPNTGAFAAVFKSFKYVKRNLLSFLKLDLSFWWYYGIGLLLTAVAYLDQILPALGINLGVSGELAYLIAYGLYAIGWLLLAFFATPQVVTAYAIAYDTVSYD